MAQFKWTSKREAVALSLAQGDTIAEAADNAGVSSRTVNRWKANVEFAAEVDRLTHMVGISSRAERLRIAMRVVKARTLNQFPRSERDLLDWLKFAQSETDGVKLDLTALLEAATSLADGGSEGTNTED